MHAYKILIVEDEILISKQLELILSKCGYQIAGVASEGNKAIELAETTSPELILMDINLKGELDGIDTAKRIRNINTVPIIFLSAYSDRMTQERISAITSSSYMSKPFVMKDLVNTVEFTLNEYRKSRSPDDFIQ